MSAETRKVNCNDTSSEKFLTVEEERSIYSGLHLKCLRGKNDNPAPTTEEEAEAVVDEEGVETAETKTRIEEISIKTSKATHPNSFSKVPHTTPQTSSTQAGISNRTLKTSAEVAVEEVLEFKEDGTNAITFRLTSKLSINEEEVGANQFHGKSITADLIPNLKLF